MRSVRNRRGRSWPKASGLLLLAAALAVVSVAEEPEYPVEPELFIDEFDASEGITFNARGELFVAANRAVWSVSPEIGGAGIDGNGTYRAPAREDAEVAGLDKVTICATTTGEEQAVATLEVGLQEEK